MSQYLLLLYFNKKSLIYEQLVIKEPLEQSAMPKCDYHQQNQSFICLEDSCARNRLACESCIQTHHYRHNIHFISKSIKPLMNLNINSKQRQAFKYRRQLKQLKDELFQEIKSIDDLCKSIIQWKKYLENKLLSHLQILSDTFSNDQIDSSWEILMGNNSNKFQENEVQKKLRLNKIETIVSNISFLEDLTYDSPGQIVNISKAITYKISSALNTFINQAKLNFDNMNDFIQHYSFPNIIKNNLLSELIKSEEQLEVQKPVAKKLNQIEIQQFVESKEVSTKQPNSTNMNNKQTKLEVHKRINNIEVDQQEITISNSICKISNGVIKIKSNEIIASQTIQESLKLCNNIREIYVYGLNDFDVKCLQLAVLKFPNLQILSYLPKIESDAIDLQISQVFLSEKSQIRDNSLPVTKEVFDLYSAVPELRNLYIGNLKKFEGQNLKIRNKKIQCLTLGNFMQRDRFEIPVSLISEINFKINHLLVLNLFNIQLIPDGLIQNICKKNVNLRQIWMSECKGVHTSNFCMKDSRLKVFIADCLDIKSNILLPETIESLFLDNCKLEKSIDGILNARHVKHFSMLQTKCDLPIIDIVLQELALNNSQSLQYLNLGMQQSVNDQNLETIRLFSNLKYLCLSQTTIKMSNFVKIRWFNSKELKKLDITFRHSFKISERFISEVGQIFPNLQTLFCYFCKNFTAETWLNFKNLSNICFYTAHNSKNKAEIEYVSAFLTKKNIKVTIMNNTGSQ